MFTENNSLDSVLASNTSTRQNKLFFAATHEESTLIAALLTDEHIDPNMTNENGYTALILAASMGNTAAVIALLADERTEPNIQDKDDHTALIFAAESGHTAAITALLTNERTEPNIQNKDGNTALIYAAIMGYTAAVTALLSDERIDANIKNIAGHTALMVAAATGHTETVKVLLANERTEPNIQDKDGDTALMLAAGKGHNETITALLADQHTEPNIQNENGETALMLAAHKGYNTAVTALLDDERTDPNIQGNHTALIFAAGNGHTAAITALLANERTEPNIQDKNGASALIYAVRQGSTAAITTLLANERTEPNIQDKNGDTALILAATAGHTETVKAFLANERTEPNIQDENGMTALMFATRKGHSETITALLTNKSTNPNIKDENGFTALILAATAGHTETVKAFLANERTEPNTQDKSGNTALIIAACNGHTQAIKALLANEHTDPNIQDKYGNTALILAATNRHSETITALLTNKSTNPNIQDANGFTALMLAAGKGHTQAITALLAYERTDPNFKNQHGNSALLIAAIEGHTETIKALLAYERTDPNIQKENGDTALMLATRHGHTAAITALLTNERTDPNIKNENDYTALMFAAAEGHTETIKALLANERTDPNIQKKNGDTALMLATRHGHTQAIKALLHDKRTEPNIQDENGNTVLMYAALKRHTQAIKALLHDKRTEPNIRDKYGNTALMYAVNKENTATITALLANERTDPNTQNKDGYSALLAAAYKGHPAAITALLANKRTDPYIKHQHGNSALLIAATKGHTETIKALLHDKRTEPNIQDENGMTALMFATRKGHTQAVKTLLTDRRIDPNIANNQGKIALNYITSAKHGVVAEILMHDARLISQLNAENISLVLSKRPSTKILKTIISAHPSLTFNILLDNSINMRSRTVLLQHCESTDYFAADTAKCAELMGLISQNSALFEHKKMPACFKPTAGKNPNHLLKLTQLFRLDSLAELEHLLQSCSPILKQQSIGFLAQLSDANKADLIDYIHGWHHIFNNVKTFTANGTLPGQDHDATISQYVNADPNRDWAVVLEPHQQFQTLQNANRHADLSKDVAIFLTLLERSFYVKAYGLDLDATAFTAAVQAHYHTLKTKVQRVGENIQLKYQRFGVKFLEDLKKNLETCYPKFIRNHQDKITYTIDQEEQQLYYQMAHLDPEHSKIADINTYLKQYPLQLPDETPIAKALTSSGTISATLSLHKALNDPEELAEIIGKKTLSCLSLCYKHCNGKELPVTVADLQGLLQDLQNNPKMTKSSCLFWSFRENEPSPLQKQSLFEPAVTTTITATAAKAITANEQAAFTDNNGGTAAEGSHSTVVPSALAKAAPKNGGSIKKESQRIEPNLTISSSPLMATVSGSSGGHRQENQSITPASACPSPSIVNVANPTAKSTTAKEGSVSLQALEIIAHSLPARINSTRRFIQESTGCLPAAADEDVATATKQQQQHCCAALEEYLRKIYNQYYQHIDVRSTKIDAPATTKTAQLYTGANALLEEFQQFQVSHHNNDAVGTYYLSAIGDDIEHLIRDLIKLNQVKAYTQTANKTNTSPGPTATKPSHGFTVHEHCRSANPLWLALKCDIQALRSHSFACYNPNWAKFIGCIYGQVRSLRKSLPPGQSQLPQSLQHDFYAQANSLLYYLDFKKCIDKQTAVSTVIENTVESYHSSGQQTAMRPVDQARYQRNHNILETALTASILADQPTPVDTLFLAFAWHDLQKAYLFANNIKLSTVLTNYGGPCHAIKIVKKLRNDFTHSDEILEQNMTSVAALTAWINQQCARINTGTYAKHLANHPDPDQQLKCLLGDALLQYSQLVSAVLPVRAFEPIAVEPSLVQQNLKHSSHANLPSSQCRSSAAAEPDAPKAKPPQLEINRSIVTVNLSVPMTALRSTSSTAFAQQQKSRVVEGSSLCEANTVSKTPADELTARHHSEDNRMDRQHSKSELSVHAKVWTPELISTATSSSKPSTSG